MQRNFRGMGILSISIFIGMLILMGMAMDLFAHNYEESGRNQKYMQEITFSDKNTLHNGSNTGYSTNYSGYSATSSYGSSSDKNNVPSTKPSGISTGAAYTAYTACAAYTAASSGSSDTAIAAFTSCNGIMFDVRYGQISRTRCRSRNVGYCIQNRCICVLIGAAYYFS